MPKRRQPPPSDALADRLGVSTAIPKSGGGDLIVKCAKKSSHGAARWQCSWVSGGKVYEAALCDACRFDRSVSPETTNYKERRRRV